MRKAWRAGALLGVAALLACPAAAGAQVKAPTFAKDVAPILFANCTSCHQPNGIGPFDLRSYGDARPRAQAIARAVRTRSMPPWKPEPLEQGAFIGDRRLAEADIATIERWVALGAPEGEPAGLPAAAPVTEGWQLGRPDLILTLSEPYELPAGSRDLLRNVVIPVPVNETRFVRGLEFHPGNPRVVHHANIRVDPTGASRLLDAADPAPGFDGAVARAEFPDGYFLGWTPGQVPPLLPDGLSWRLDARSDLVVQLHLHGTDRAEIVQPTVGLYFADRAPDRTPLMVRLGRQDIDIPPGEPRYEVEDRYTLPVDTTILGVQPHAHFRAREIRGSLTLPDGTERTLITIHDWDFNWQDVYRYAQPLAAPRGSVLSMRYTYDNSPANRRNPDVPPVRVRWGQKSTDEMGDLWIQVLAGNDADRRILRDDVQRKVLAEDAIGYEMLLQRDGTNARLHEAVAAIDLSLGRFDEAAAHLETVLGTDPRSAEAHYNLALAQIPQGRRADAIGHLRLALEVDPEHVPARVNLGALLRADGRVDEAIAELRRALAFEPSNPAAHTNLAGALASEGRIVDAVAEYRAAVDSGRDVPEALVSLAWILATCPAAALRQPQEAVRLAERAAALNAARDVRTVDTLAAAYAATGDFTRALSLVEPAAVDARHAGRDRDARILDSRVASYRKRLPYRDPALAPTP